MSGVKYCSADLSRKITILSFLAMVTVVCIHSDPLELMDNPSVAARMFSRGFDLLKLWAVPFFYMVSGYFFSRRIDVGKEIQYGKLVSSKWRGLILPYLLWGGIYGTIVSLPLIVATNRKVGNPIWQRSVFDGGGGFFGVVDRMFGLVIDQSPANGALWFLRVLIIFFLLAPLWIFIYRRAFGLLVGIAFILMGSPYMGFGDYFVKMPSVGWILVGMCAGKLKLDVAKPSIWLVMLPAIGLGYLSWIGCGHWADVAWEFAVIAVIWRCYDWLNISAPAELPRVMHLSFWIYCMHHWIAGYTGAAFRMVLGRGELSYWIQIVSIPTITIGVCVLSAKLIEKFMPRVFSILNGAR